MVSDKLRLGIFSDSFSKNTFIFKTCDYVFARVDNIGKEWCVWYYKYHTQKNYKTLREAISDINSHFLNYCCK